MIKLDYTLETPEERQQLVEKILEENPNVNETYLETLADYLIIAIEKKEKKEGKRKALTENRQATIAKREISFEGLAAQFENGEDGIYNLITDNKHTIFRPKSLLKYIMLHLCMIHHGGVARRNQILGNEIKDYYWTRSLHSKEGFN